MSSTNRSNARDKHISDYYVTPIDCIEDFFKAFQEDVSGELGKLTFLDPCAGGDEKNPMSYPQFIKTILCGGMIKTIDIREDSLAEKKGDYLKMKLSYQPHIIITNPPFNLAQEIITKALYDVKDGGYVIMLLRLNFFCSKARKQFWDKQLPALAYIHHRRMSFTEDGKTDSIEYMHAVWKKCYFPKHTKIKVI